VRDNAGVRTSVDLYFAYGSNLTTSRMLERVPSARLAGRAHLAGYRLQFDKRGRDGSAKANVAVDPGGEVWGVAFEMHAEGWPTLDRFEPGYQRLTVQIALRDGTLRRAETYQSDDPTPDPRPFAWYLKLVVDGAREHELPSSYVEKLESTPTRPDPPSRA